MRSSGRVMPPRSGRSALAPAGQPARCRATARRATRLKPTIGIGVHRAGAESAAAARDLADVLGQQLAGRVHQRDAGDQHDDVGEQLDRREGASAEHVVDDVDRDVPVECGEVPGHHERGPHQRQPSDLAGPGQADPGTIALGDLRQRPGRRLPRMSSEPTTCSPMPMPCTIERHGSRAGSSSGFDSPPRLVRLGRRPIVVRRSVDRRQACRGACLRREPSAAHPPRWQGRPRPVRPGSQVVGAPVPGEPGTGYREPTRPRRSGSRREPRPARA